MKHGSVQMTISKLKILNSSGKTGTTKEVVAWQSTFTLRSIQQKYHDQIFMTVLRLLEYKLSLKNHFNFSLFTIHRAANHQVTYSLTST
jgi:hypothetical protein